jgi:hypothetical protein
MYLDGRRIGTAQNDGHGGPDSYDFNSPEDRQAFEACVAEWVESVKDDPEYQTDDGRCFASDECMVGEACTNFRREREMKRALKGYETVIRIERPKGWMTNILTVSLPSGHDPEPVIAEEIEEGDKVFTYRADTGVVAR